MPALFSVALAPALHDLQREPTEQVLAYLDDVYILASPDRVALLYRRLEEHIWQRARVRLNASRTRVWNAAGVLPDGVPQLAPESAVWVGDHALSPEQRPCCFGRAPRQSGLHRVALATVTRPPCPR